MLVWVEAIELLELIVDLGRHLQANQFESRPISRLQALDRKVEVRACADGLLLITWICEEGLKLLCLLFNRVVVLKHALQLVHLLHATRDF